MSNIVTAATTVGQVQHWNRFHSPGFVAVNDGCKYSAGIEVGTNSTGKDSVAGLTFKFSVAANLKVIVSGPSTIGREMRDGLKS